MSNFAGLSPRGRGNLLCAVAVRRLSQMGLSPRGRGNHAAISIPYSLTLPVYPRVGGATAPEEGDNNNLAGLSPRGRGNLL